ncbi:MAG: class I SAM-dependent methyltransferase [Pseudolabrys sp.]|nr:class I SAM-dependent methyltransferase [Pseudolabrys sp.]
MISTALAGHCCRICGSSALHEFERFRGLKRVTSDSRTWKAGGRITVCHECGAVQKPVEPDWKDDINQIYQSYAIYHQAAGEEQPIFAGNGGPPQPRSRSLTQYFEDKLRLPTRANVLDFGCGTGSALKTYSANYSGWKLYGAELSNRSLPILEKIPGFAELFTCPPADIALRFDFITLIHALEHVLDPVATLRDLAGRLADSGVLFVQVPDGAKTPYDLVIADHLLHFSLETLRFAAERAGCHVIEVTDSVLPKELSLIVRSGKVQTVKPRLPDSQAVAGHLALQIDWLFDQIASADALAGKGGPFGLFGTSISATWLAGIIGDRVSFFVDEDEGRIGGQHMGRPVFAPNEAPGNADIFVPLIPNIAASVVQRLSRPGVKFHAPPPFREQTADQEVGNVC